jgi:tetratricopeptide (TPR) repeat protein
MPPGKPEDLWVGDNTAYVAAFGAGLMIFDLANGGDASRQSVRSPKALPSLPKATAKKPDAPPTPGPVKSTAEKTASVSTLVQRGYLAMDRHQTDPAALDQALADFERGHELDPDHLDARFGLAWARQVKGLPASDWRELYQDTAAEAAALAYLSLYNLAYAERQAGRNREAATLLARALAVMPERADGWTELGSLYDALGEHGRAVGAYREAAELEPDSARIFFLLGVARNHLGQATKAEDAWARALQLDPAWKDQIEAARGVSH